MEDTVDTPIYSHEYELLSEKITGTNIRIDSLEKSLNARIDGLEKSLNARIDSTNTRIDNLEKSLNTRIDNTNTRIDSTNTRIDSLEKSLNTRIDDLKDSLNRGIAVLGISITILGILVTAVLGILIFLMTKLV